MADELVGTKCSASNSLNYSNYSNLHGVHNCEKCAELELQLHLVRDELSSVQLIIQMLTKEQVHKDTITKQIQHVEVKRQGDESWKMITNKGTKKRSEGTVKLKDNDLLNTKEVILTANRFTALETNSNTTSNEYGMRPASENKPSATGSDKEREVKNM